MTEYPVPAELATVDHVLADLTDATEGLVVIDATNLASANELLVRITRERKAADALRQQLVKPLNQHVKYINGLFKDRIGPMEELEQELRRGVGRYHQAERERLAEVERQQRQRLEEQAAARQAEQQRLAEAAGVAPDVAAEAAAATAVDAAAVRITQDTHRDTSDGAVDVRWVPRWEVTDEGKLPRMLLQVNDKAVRSYVLGIADSLDNDEAAVQAACEPMGLHVWLESQVRVTTARTITDDEEVPW